MVFDSKKLLKDITKLGRDIRKIVIVDNIVDNFRNCLANGLVIDSWVGDRKDNALINIIPVLKNVVDKQVEDVR
jgi:CTD small phosphatase-like protein 2